MAISDFIDAMAAHLSASLKPPPVLVGGASPATAADMPAVTLAVADVVSPHPGIGRQPRATVEGALRVGGRIDLADPVLRLQGDAVPLLSPDRRTLQLPHGSVVRADGTDLLPFAASDLDAAVGGAAVALVPAPPGPGQMSVNPQSGALTFGAPLAAAGTLTLGYFVGLWDVEVERMGGEVTVDMVAADAAAVETLTRQVEAALSPPTWRHVAGLQDLQPVALGRIAPPDAAIGPGRRRTLTYRFNYERSIPVVRTSGGPIRQIAVDVINFGEQFTIT